MAKFLLLNRVTLSNGVEIKAAKELDDLVDDIPNIVASGGITLALPNPVVEARAAQIREQQGRGRREAELDLLTAAFAEFASGASMSLAIKDEGVFVPGSPFGIANFTGAGVTVTNEGGGQAKIDIPGTPGGTVPATRTINAGTGLTGGGDLSADRTLSADLAVLNPTTIQPDAVATPGAGTTIARQDHRHAIVTDPPVNVGTANTEGVSTSFARADHVHNLPFGPVQTALGAATSAISVNSQEVTNGATPLAASSLATKAYVDSLALGLKIKLPSRVIATAPIALAAPQVIDGVAVVAGNRVLVVGQGGDPTVPDVDNGVYVVAAGAWTRATDLAIGSAAAGAFVWVEQGATYADTGWVCVNDSGSDIVGTDLLQFTQFTGGVTLAILPPADVTKAAAAVGVSGRAAREDHKHDVSTAVPVTVSSVNTEGTATSLARSDHVHAHGSLAGGSTHAAVTVLTNGYMIAADKSKLDGISAGAAALTASAPADVTKAAAAVGVATDAARADHKHDISTAAPAATGVATASAEGTATSLARSDHAHQSNTAPVNVTKAAASIGTSGEPARADHKHDITTATAVAVGSANAEGTSTSLSRADHVHLGDSAILLWGNDSLTATTTTRYLTPCYGESTARTAPVQWRVPRAGTLSNLRVRQNTGAGNGNSIVYTIRINGTASALSVSMASTANDAGPDTDTVAVAAGDLVDIEVTKAVAVGTTPSDNIASVEYRA